MARVFNASTRQKHEKAEKNFINHSLLRVPPFSLCLRGFLTLNFSHSQLFPRSPLPSQLPPKSPYLQ